MKRNAQKQLTVDNYEEDNDDHDSDSVFKVASKTEIEKRVIIQPRRKTAKPNDQQPPNNQVDYHASLNQSFISICNHVLSLDPAVDLSLVFKQYSDFRNNQKPPSLSNAGNAFPITHTSSLTPSVVQETSPVCDSNNPDVGKPFLFASNTRDGAVKPFAFASGSDSTTPASIGESKPEVGKPFTFGSSDVKADAAKPFSFGSSDAKADAAKPFSFGSSDAKAEIGKPFTFGSSDATAKPFSSGSSFGSSGAKPEIVKPFTIGSSGAKAEIGKPFTFGPSDAKADVAKPFSFGSSDAKPDVAQPFSSGSSDAKPEIGKPLTFGAKTDVAKPFSLGSFGAQPEIGKPFTFGSPDAKPDAAHPFSFGSSGATPDAGKPFSFGSSDAKPDAGKSLSLVNSSTITSGELNMQASHPFVLEARLHSPSPKSPMESASKSPVAKSPITQTAPTKVTGQDEGPVKPILGQQLNSSNLENPKSPVKETKPLGGFSFAASITSASTPVFGASSTPFSFTSPEKPAEVKQGQDAHKPVFSFNSVAAEPKNPSTFTFGNTGSANDNSVKSFSFAQSAVAAPFTFGAKPSTDSAAGFTFGMSTQSNGFQNTTPNPFLGKTVSSDTLAEEGDAMPHEEQIDLMKGAGEDGEEELINLKAKLFRKNGEEYIVAGVGQIKLLKDAAEKKSRLIFRAEGSGRVLLNDYVTKSTPSLKVSDKRLSIVMRDENGEFCTWLIHVKLPADCAMMYDKLKNVE